MTHTRTLVYEYCELTEKEAKHLNPWKAWHLTLYILITIFGVLNYTFLQSTKQMVDDRCVFYPHKLAFHMVEIPSEVKIVKQEILPVDEAQVKNVTENAQKVNVTAQEGIDTAQQNNGTVQEGRNGAAEQPVKQNVEENFDNVFETSVEIDNVTVVVENRTHRLVLDTTRTFFISDNDCQFAEYIPILSTAFAMVWLTFFTMCPGGGRSKTGLQEPWSILAPALIFAMVLVGITGSSFTQTNGGIQAFCGAFYNYTNSTTCSSVDRFLERSWQASWSFSGRASATRAACAGVVASWACAAALMLARCMTAADFVVKRKRVEVQVDPQQKITPHLKKSPRRSPRPSPRPHAPDVTSVKSEPTFSTQLVEASIDQTHETAPPSLATTPTRNQDEREMVELAYSPTELRNER